MPTRPEDFRNTAAMRNAIIRYWKKLNLSTGVVGYDYAGGLGAYRSGELSQGMGLDWDQIRDMGLPAVISTSYRNGSNPDPARREFTNIWNGHYHLYRARVNGYHPTPAEVRGVVRKCRETSRKNRDAEHAAVMFSSLSNTLGNDVHKKRKEKRRRETIVNSYIAQHEVRRMTNDINAVVPAPGTAYPTQADKDSALKMMKEYEGQRLVEIFDDLLPYTLKRSIELSNVLAGANHTNMILQIARTIETERQMLEDAGEPVNDAWNHEFESFLEGALTEAKAKLDPAFAARHGFVATKGRLGEQTFKRLAPEKYHAQRMVRAGTTDPFQAYLNYKFLQNWANA